MLKVGLTGGIGSGKTTIAKIFISLGVPVFCSDEIAKKLQHTNTELIGLLKKEFGDDIYDIKGRIISSLLAKRVFNDKLKLEKLNNLVHPFVFRYFNQWLLKQNSKYIIKESALIFNSKNYYLDNDFNILVNSKESTRISRVINRSHLSYSEVIERIKNQVNFEKFENIADFIIDNNQEALIPQVIFIHNKIIDYINT